MKLHKCLLIVMSRLLAISALNAQTENYGQAQPPTNNQTPASRAAMMYRRQPVPVPDFKGKTLQQAQAAAVVPGTTTPLFAGIDAQGPTGGAVASQTPVAGTPVIPGQTRLLLTLDTPQPSPWETILQQIIADRKRAARVPQLYGDTQDAATRLLGGARLRGKFIGDPGGLVSQQSPPAGNSVAPGSTVTVTLALPQVTVPWLYGMTVAEATQRLEEGSLQRGTIYGVGIKGVPARVASQSVPAGTSVPPGTVVDVTLTPPPAPPPPPPPPGQPTQPVQQPVEQPTPPKIFVPNLSKMKSSDAVFALKRAGLRTGTVKGPSTGSVSDQQPAASTRVDAGTAVDFELSLPTVVVPDVMEESAADAAGRVQVFGLQPKLVRADDWDDKVNHVVVEERPAAGTSVPVGSAVTVVVGNAVAPPSAWKRFLTGIAAAGPLVPWWGWLVIGAGLAGVGALIKKRVWPPQKPVVVTPLATCTLVATHVMAQARIGHSGEPAVRFAIGLRDHAGVAKISAQREPEVTRKG